MMKRFLLLAVLVAASFCAGSLALAMSARPSQDISTRDRHQCFDPKFLRGFQTAGDNNIVITSDDNQAYELTLGGACIGLDSTFMIGIRSRLPMSDICGPFDAEIVYNDFGPRRCPIIAMRHLQGADADPYIYKRHDKAPASASANNSQ
jgi:hypothetical protein